MLYLYVLCYSSCYTGCSPAKHFVWKFRVLSAKYQFPHHRHWILERAFNMYGTQKCSPLKSRRGRAQQSTEHYLNWSNFCAYLRMRTWLVSETICKQHSVRIIWWLISALKAKILKGWKRNKFLSSQSCFEPNSSCLSTIYFYLTVFVCDRTFFFCIEYKESYVGRNEIFLVNTLRYHVSVFVNTKQKNQKSSSFYQTDFYLER